MKEVPKVEGKNHFFFNKHNQPMEEVSESKPEPVPVETDVVKKRGSLGNIYSILAHNTAIPFSKQDQFKGGKKKDSFLALKRYVWVVDIIWDDMVILKREKCFVNLFGKLEGILNDCDICMESFNLSSIWLVY